MADPQLTAEQIARATAEYQKQKDILESLNDEFDAIEKNLTKSAAAVAYFANQNRESKRQVSELKGIYNDLSKSARTLSNYAEDYSKGLLKTKDISSACIVGETASQERQHFFKEFTNKKINVLINYDILCTGIDLPKVDELFILRKFGQHTTAMQVLGRALRGERNGGNKTNKVISIKGNRDIINNANNLYNLIKNMY